jgi:outer membrane protein
MKKSLLTLCIASTLGLGLGLGLGIAAPALAEGVGKEQGSILVRARALGVIPQADATVAPLGGNIDVSTEYTPELDASYFVTSNIALEVIAASPQHMATSTALGADVVEARLLPPTLTVQYHFLPQGGISPYMGVGINYTWFYDVNPKGGLQSASLDNNFGTVLQAGVDVAVSDRWFLNVDVKQVFLNTTARLNGGAVTADLDLDPTLVGAGFGYRF